MEEVLGENTFIADDANPSMLHEFGYVETIVAFQDKEYEITFLVVEPSDGTVRDDLWYVAIEDADSYYNARLVGIALDLEEEKRIIDEELISFILDCYANKSLDSYESIRVVSVSPSHTIETGYVSTILQNVHGGQVDIYFDIIQPSNGDWYVAIDEENLELLKEEGVEIETELIEFTGGYIYDCIKGEDFNFILDWYDSICCDKR